MTASIGGRYRLEQAIGRGASGQVWRAHDTTLDRVVALKRLGAPYGSTAAATDDHRRNLREAHLAARLSHPHVVAVFDLVSDDDGSEWLVMEYVQGRDLASIVRERGPLRPEDAARYVGQVADALAAAHAAGIVHRDVKPSNILLRTDDQALLSDFGIARATADPSLTRTGLVTGSPAYLAPEVAAGASATPASDVWSWGATLYHLLTGRTPYAGDDGEHVLGTLYRIVNETPPRLDGFGWPAALLEVTLTHDLRARWDMARLRDAIADGGPGRDTAVAGIPAGAPRPTVPAPRPAPRPPSRPAPDAVPLDATAVLTATPRAAAPAAPPHLPDAAATPSAAAVPPPASRRAALLAGSALAIVVLLGGLWMLTRGDAGPTGASSASSSQGRDADANGVGTPSAAAMTSFAEDYVRTASSNPEAGFRLLTPAYQRASGGLDGYLTFWSRVVRIKRLDDVRADPDDLTVSYRYAYVLRGAGARTEDVRLRLEYRRDGSFRISGAV